MISISRNPLTGFNPLQLSSRARGGRGPPGASQSPYGVQSLATSRGPPGPPPTRGVAIPLRGSIPCNPEGDRPHLGTSSGAVAIPLRGSIPCNGTPQRTPSWTAPPEGGFVRKMKLGICTRRITGVFEGLHRWKATGERGDEKKKRIFAFRKGKNGFQDPHPEVRVGKSIAHTATLHQVKISAKKRLPK